MNNNKLDSKCSFTTRRPSLEPDDERLSKKSKLTDKPEGIFVTTNSNNDNNTPQVRTIVAAGPTDSEGKFFNPELIPKDILRKITLDFKLSIKFLRLTCKWFWEALDTNFFLNRNVFLKVRSVKELSELKLTMPIQMPVCFEPNDCFKTTLGESLFALRPNNPSYECNLTLDESKMTPLSQLIQWSKYIRLNLSVSRITTMKSNSGLLDEFLEKSTFNQHKELVREVLFRYSTLSLDHLENLLTYPKINHLVVIIDILTSMTDDDISSYQKLLEKVFFIKELVFFKVLFLMPGPILGSDVIEKITNILVSCILDRKTPDSKPKQLETVVWHFEGNYEQVKNLIEKFAKEKRSSQENPPPQVNLKLVDRYNTDRFTVAV